MTVRLLVVTGLLATLLVPGRALAEVRMPDGTPLPQKVLFEDNLPTKVWVAYQGYRPLELPAAKAPTAEGKPRTFMEPFFVSATYPRKGGKDNLAAADYVLLVRADANHEVKETVGWAAVQHVATNHALVNPTTKIHIKAMIVNTVAALKDDKLGGPAKFEVDVAPVYFVPEATKDAALQAKPVTLHTMLFVYADTNKTKEEEGFVLLGLSSEFNSADPAEARQTILGWVPKNRVCRWDTREALEWDVASTKPDAAKRRTQRGEVYRTLEHAFSVWPPEKKADYLFRETFKPDGVSVGLPASNSMRFPILPWPHKKTNTHQYGKLEHHLYFVGFYGGFISEKGDEVLSVEQLDKLKEDLKEIREMVTQTELLFVIDDTASMGKWFKETAKVCKDILNDLKQHPEIKLRVAVTFYNDVLSAKDDPDKAVQAMQLKNFDATAAKEIIKELDTHEEHGGGDPREQVFRGLIHGINKAKFEPRTRKIVILIGDRGNNPRWDKVDDPKRPSEKVIADLLVRKGQSPIEFYAIQVVDPDRDIRDLTDEDKDAVLGFRAKAREILKLAKANLEKLKLKHYSPGEYTVLKDEAAFRKKLLDGYQRLKARAAEMAQQLTDLELGRFNTEIGPELLDIIKQWNIPLDELRKHFKGAQLFNRGYVWETNPDGLRQMKKRLLVNSKELDEVIRIIKHIEFNKKSPQDLIKTIIQEQAGEAIDAATLAKTSFDEVCRKAFGLSFQSKLLKAAMQDFAAVRVSEHELQIIRYKRHLLEDLREGKRYDYQVKKEDVGGAVVEVWYRKGSTAMVEDRGFVLGNDASFRWYWVDWEEEWP